MKDYCDGCVNLVEEKWPKRLARRCMADGDYHGRTVDTSTAMVFGWTARPKWCKGKTAAAVNNPSVANGDNSLR